MTSNTSNLIRTRPLSIVTESLVLTGRSLRHAIREVDSLLLGLLLPVFLMVLFVNVFGGAIDSDGGYIEYVVPGIVMLTAGYGASMVSVSVARDMTTGMIERFRSLPMSSVGVFLGHTLATLLRNLFSTGLVVGVAIAMGFRPVGELLPLLGVVGVSALFILSVAWLATVVGVVATPEAAGGFTFFVLFLPYVSSAFVPIDTLPDWMQGFATNQPVTHIVETLRGLLLGTPVGDHALPAVLWCAGVAAVAIPLTAFLYRKRTTR